MTNLKYTTLSLFSILIFSCGNEEKNIENETTVIENISDSTKTLPTTLGDSVSIDSIENRIDTDTTNIMNTDNKTVPVPKDKMINGDLKELIENDVVINDKGSNVSNSNNPTIKNDNTEIDTKEESNQPFNHQIWDALLKKYVSSSGKVNYKGFKSEKSKLEEYIKQLQEEYSGLKSWSKNKQLAYWINVYNVYTIKLIVDNYPVKSIKDINGGQPWKKKFIFLGGNTYSLNNVENDIIRPRYKERRIHFAVNCASISCPKLLNQAFTESNLNRKLTQLTKSFLNNKSKNVLEKKKVKISKIFEWYQTDFTKTGDIIPFIKEYTDIEINDNAKVEYLEYNWNLNE